MRNNKTHYIHHLPGRLRIKTSLAKRNQDVSQNLQNLLSPVLGIQSVLANPLTGSILIRYDLKTIDFDSILEILKNAGYIEPGKNRITNYDKHKFSEVENIFWKAVFGVLVKKAFSGSKVSLIQFFLR